MERTASHPKSDREEDAHDHQGGCHKFSDIAVRPNRSFCRGNEYEKIVILATESPYGFLPGVELFLFTGSTRAKFADEAPDLLFVLRLVVNYDQKLR